MDKLTRSLRAIASNLVGNAGESTERSLSVTGEEYVVFAMKFKDRDEVIDVWTEWIQAYKKVAKYSMGGTATVYEGQDLTLYWRTLPEIIDENWIYARLLITHAPVVKIVGLDASL